MIRRRPAASRGLRILVPAKVNLFLRVLRRRRDGFHSIETVFHTIGLWDELHLVPGRGSGLTSTGLPTPRGRRNLCVKACRLLQRHVGSTPQARIHLIKRIPSGAGLGGGSADAAACLLGLNRLWRLNLTRAVLHRLATQLGSDVPFFLAGKAAIGRGRGERLSPLRTRLRAWAVVLKPRLNVSTRRAYRAIDRNRPGRAGKPGRINAVVAALRQGGRKGLKTHNDFESVLSVPHPKLSRLREALLQNGAHPVFLTGSGSAVVGLVKNRTSASRLAQKLRRTQRVAALIAPIAPLTIRIQRLGRTKS